MSVARLLFLAVLTLTVLHPAQAVAEPADGQLWREVRLAERYWAARGVVADRPVIPSFEDLPPGKYGRAMIGSYAFVIDTDVRRAARRRDPWLRRDGLETEASTVLHEYAHAIGWLPPLDQADTTRPSLRTDGSVYLENGHPIYVHTKTGLMRAEQWDDAIPLIVRAYARRVIRETHAQVMQGKRFDLT